MHERFNSCGPKRNYIQRLFGSRQKVSQTDEWRNTVSDLISIENQMQIE